MVVSVGVGVGVRVCACARVRACVTGYFSMPYSYVRADAPTLTICVYDLITSMHRSIECLCSHAFIRFGLSCNGIRSQKPNK